MVVERQRVPCLVTRSVLRNFQVTALLCVPDGRDKFGNMSMKFFLLGICNIFLAEQRVFTFCPYYLYFTCAWQEMNCFHQVFVWIPGKFSFSIWLRFFFCSTPFYLHSVTPIKHVRISNICSSGAGVHVLTFLLYILLHFFSSHFGLGYERILEVSLSAHRSESHLCPFCYLACCSFSFLQLCNYFPDPSLLLQHLH